LIAFSWESLSDPELRKLEISTIRSAKRIHDAVSIFYSNIPPSSILIRLVISERLLKLLIHRSIEIYRGKIESHERRARGVQGDDSPALRFAFHAVHRAKDIRYLWVAYPAGSSYRSKIEQSVFPSVPLPFAILYVSSSRNVAVSFFTSSLARVVKTSDWRVLVAFAFSNPVCRPGCPACRRHRRLERNE